MKRTNPSYRYSTLLIALCALAIASATREAEADERAELLREVKRDARHLAAEGRYEEALQRHIWYHRHVLYISSAQRGVRLSFMLSDWVELGAKYPPAMEALRRIRDEGAAQLRAGIEDRQLFIDVAAINGRALNEPGRTVGLFKKLHASNPAFARRCYFDITEVWLVEAGEFELCAEYLGDPDERFTRLVEDRAKRMEEAARIGAMHRIDIYNNIFADRVCRILKVLAGTGRLAKAKEIQRKALAIHPHEQIADVLAPARPVIVIYHVFGRADQPGPQTEVEAAVWADGRIVWRADGALLENRINTQTVEDLIQRLHGEGVLGTGQVDYANFGPDSSYDVIDIRADDQRLRLRSWHERFEQNPNLVVTRDGVEPLGARNRDAVLAEQPEEYRRFRRVWAEIRATVNEWRPSEGEPFTGTIRISDTD